MAKKTRRVVHLACDLSAFGPKFAGAVIPECKPPVAGGYPELPVTADPAAITCLACRGYSKRNEYERATERRKKAWEASPHYALLEPLQLEYERVQKEYYKALHEASDRFDAEYDGNEPEPEPLYFLH